MEDPRAERDIYQWFRISILLKGLISVVEVISGIAILFVTPALVHQLARLMVNGELAKEPYDAIATHILTFAYQYTTGLEHFLSLYLLSRGLVKVGLIWALLKNQLWAYPLSLVVLFGFVIYQIYQIVTTQSLIVLAITLFDLVVIYFIWKEWQVVKRHGGRQVVAA